MDEASLKKRFRALSLQYHPDKGGSAEEFRAVKRAYEVIGDERMRAKYATFGLDMGGENAEFSSKIMETLKEGSMSHFAVLAVYSVVLWIMNLVSTNQTYFKKHVWP